MPLCRPWPCPWTRTGISFPAPAQAGFFITLDKLDKIGWDGVRAELDENGFPAGSAVAALDMITQLQGLPGLSREVVEKLERVRPLTLGQAGRIPGITPAAVSIINVYLDLPARPSAGS